MRQRKVGAKVKPSAESLLLASLDTKLGRLAPMLLRLNAAEMERDQAVKDLTELRSKLTGLLSPEQLDAARTCGCAPEVYAIEVLELYKERVFPKFRPEIRPLGHPDIR